MRTVEKIRFSVAAQQAVKSAISEQVEIELWELDTNAPIGLGSFSKARSSIGTFYDAVNRARQLILEGCKSDLLLKPRHWRGYDRNGWQVWERRRDTGRRVETAGGGSRMPRQACGTGKVFML